MFEPETVNAFVGGYEISASGIINVAGSPELSNLGYSISMPISLSLNVLARADSVVHWKGTNEVIIPYQISKTSNEWFDPIKILTNISIQRGWQTPPYVLAEEDLKFHMGLAYYSAFIDVLIRAFSLVNNVNLGATEIMELSREVQEITRGFYIPAETLTRINGSDGSIFIYDEKNRTFRNEPLKLEPYSLVVISGNSLEENENYRSFQRNMEKFRRLGMINQKPSSLSYPFLNFLNHFSTEQEMVENIMDALLKDNTDRFISGWSKYSQSIGYNLGVISNFQKTVASLLEKYSISNYVFAVSEYSGSVIALADSPVRAKISENLVRDYFGLTNGTLNITEVQNRNDTKMERIIL
ncbi:MAG: hypothetical protein QXU18_15120 [Thermoplasmatales archaeon]